MGNLKNFQLIIIILFVFGGILGVFVFAGFIDLGGKGVNNKVKGNATIWGTYPNTIINPILTEINQNADINIKYVYKDPNTFENELVEAFLAGKGPDLFFFPDNFIIKHQDKVSVIPYTSYPLINFKNNFAEAGEIFLNNNGIIAFPITINPIMMYYNRTLLDSNNVVYPPSYWEELPDLVKIFTKKTPEGQILKSAFALGQVNNINNAKEILFSMFFQNGNPVTYLAPNNIYYSTLKKDQEIDAKLVNAFDFYLNFANPLNSNYSWNRSLPNSFDAFLKEDLVFYFGFASELNKIFEKNPNLNFGVYPIPQYKNNNTKATLGKVEGIAMSRFTKNNIVSYAALNLLVNGSFADKLSKALAIPPARRDLLVKINKDSYSPVFYSSALFTKTFIDPSKKDTDNLFRSLLEQVLSNGSDTKDAVESLHNRLNLLLFN